MQHGESSRRPTVFSEVGGHTFPGLQSGVYRFPIRRVASQCSSTV